MKPWSSHARRYIAAFAVVLLALPAIATGELPDRLEPLFGRGGGSSPTVVTESVVFTPAGWPVPLAGDLYLPVSASESSRLTPVVLVLHGGAWRQGDKSSVTDLGRALADRGYAAFAINYRFAPQSPYPAQLRDMQESVRWLQAHAGEHRLDMDRFALWGYSSGGYLAVLLAVQPASDLPPVRAVVAGGAPTDLRAAEAADAESVREFLGGTRAELPALYDQASPITHVRSGLPPFFLYHGRADTQVPPAQSENLARALRSAGVPVELVLLEGLDHEGAATAAGLRPQALNFLDRYLSSGGEGLPGYLPERMPGQLPAPLPQDVPPEMPVPTLPEESEGEDMLDRLRQGVPSR